MNLKSLIKVGAAAQLFLASLSFAGGSMPACLHESYMAALSLAQGTQVHEFEDVDNVKLASSETSVVWMENCVNRSHAIA